MSRGVTIHRYMDISYRECQRYAYRIVGACIDTQDIFSSGRNQAMCLKSEKLPNSPHKILDNCYGMKFDLSDNQLLCKRHPMAHFN